MDCSKQIKIVIASLVVLASASNAAAQDWMSAGRSWTGVYGFPSVSERNARLQTMLAQRRLESGAYDAGTTNYITYNTTYDHSVGDLTVSAAEGATIALETRTADGTGTSTYTVGSINTTTTDIVVDGAGNLIDISTNSESTGCQDGAITMTSSVIDGSFDISTGAAGVGTATTTTGATQCN